MILRPPGLAAAWTLTPALALAPRKRAFAQRHGQHVETRWLFPGIAQQGVGQQPAQRVEQENGRPSTPPGRRSHRASSPFVVCSRMSQSRCVRGHSLPLVMARSSARNITPERAIGARSSRLQPRLDAVKAHQDPRVMARARSALGDSQRRCFSVTDASTTPRFPAGPSLSFAACYGVDISSW